MGRWGIYGRLEGFGLVWRLLGPFAGCVPWRGSFSNRSKSRSSVKYEIEKSNLRHFSRGGSYRDAYSAQRNR